MCFKKQKPFVLKTVFFSHLACACVRESVRARDVGKGESHSCKHLSRNLYVLLKCLVCNFIEHLDRE